VLPAARQGITTAIILSIGRILAETAPLYLTSGLTSSSSISLVNPGQTLTTRIYAQIYTANIHDGINIMYECAFVTMILVLLIILVVHVVIPSYYKHKRRQLEIQSKNIRKEQEKFERAHHSLQKLFTVNDILKRKNYHVVRKRKPANKLHQKKGIRKKS
jgi:phosphate transport system permease protein